MTLSFRKKIFISYFLIFLIFIALMFPFSKNIVDRIVSKVMEDRASDLIENIQSSPTDDALVRRLKDQKHRLFFRVSIITNKRSILYDSHTKRLLGPRFTQEYVVEHPEVLKAFKTGLAHHTDYSDILGQRFLYTAKAFDFLDKRYVLRVAFPYTYIEAAARDATLGFILLATAILFFFSMMTWLIIHRLTRPIQQIIRAVRPYQEGKVDQIPEIKLRSPSTQDDFSKLAFTLNSLSERIQTHIDTLTQERNEKEAILESLVEGVIAVDKNLQIAYANTMATKLFHTSKEQLIGKDFTTIQQPKFQELLVRCQKEKSPLMLTRAPQPEDPKKRWLDVVAVPTHGKKIGAVLVLQDTSSQHELMEMRKDFIANASHELKTPITIIRGFAETLHENKSLPEKIIGEITEKIVQNCERMARLIKDLLTLADLENISRSRLVACDASAIFYDCEEILHEIAPDAQVSIVTVGEEETTIFADPDLLALAFENLLNNAAKYSTPPAKITVTLEQQKKQLKIEVSDKGLGIPAEDLPHIFHRFYTVNKAHSRKMGGSGLGLSLVETIIHKHFGTISVESKEGKGTTFTIYLPLRLDRMV